MARAPHHKITSIALPGRFVSRASAFALLFLLLP
jgi:hypothetical protein